MSARWVFVGGTGRSGTTIVAEAISAATDIRLVPTELRFHVDRGGLLDLAHGETDVRRFGRRLLGPWFQRDTPMGSRGIGEHVERSVLEAIVDGAVDAAGDDLVGTARRLWADVTTAAFGSGRLVEMTPPVARYADGLERLLGDDARTVDVVRDGRDVAHSLARMKWGPSDPITALHWWANRVREADKARRACHQPPTVIRFEDLAEPTELPRIADEIADHVGGVTGEQVFAGFAERFDVRAAHVGEWRRVSSDEHQTRVDAVYASLYGELVERGVIGLPAAPDG